MALGAEVIGSCELGFDCCIPCCYSENSEQKWIVYGKFLSFG